MKTAIEGLVRSAFQAPSGDNTQPWRFAVDEKLRRLDLFVDETRDRSAMNVGQRMSRIAVGAALENLIQAAERANLGLEQATPPAGSVASVVWKELPEGPLETPPVVVNRVTNRRPFDGRELGQDLLRDLEQQTRPQAGVATLWITGRERLAAWGRLIGRADSRMFGEPSMRAAFLSKVRFDAPPEAEVDEGLSLASLELGAPDRVALRLMRRMPQWLLRLGGATRFFAAHARKLVRTSAGLCMIVAPDGRPETDLLVGRAMQRAWLALTAQGLAVQPMMSLMVLENALEAGSAELVASLGREHLEGFRRETQDLLPELNGQRPAFLMRFGYAPDPSGRVGRLPVNASLGAPPGPTAK